MHDNSIMYSYLPKSSINIRVVSLIDSIINGSKLTQYNFFFGCSKITGAPKPLRTLKNNLFTSNSTKLTFIDVHVLNCHTRLCDIFVHNVQKHKLKSYTFEYIFVLLYVS